MSDRIRYSHLRAMSRSPLHYRAAASGETRLDSPAARLGTLVHGLVLGGDGGPVVYEGERRGNAWRDFQAAHPGVEIVTAAEVARAVPIANAVMADPVAGPLLRAEGARREVRMEWEIDGLPCSGTPDSFDPATGILLDLKTCQTAQPREFASHAWRMSYHAQLAWYAHALELAGETVRECLLVAVESAAPHGVSVHRLSPRALAEGTRSWRSWWETLRICRAADQWPGYAEAVCDLDVPAWLAGDEEEVDDAD